MKLKVFNRDNTLDLRRKDLPAIHMNARTGLIYINGAACRLIGLKAGEAVDFLNNESEPENWYLRKNSDGFTLRGKDSTTGLYLSSRPIVLMIFKQVGNTGNSGKMLIAGQPTKFSSDKLWGIIITSLKATTRKKK